VIEEHSQDKRYETWQVLGDAMDKNLPAYENIVHQKRLAVNLYNIESERKRVFNEAK
jgi:hypothetical protein